MSRFVNIHDAKMWILKNQLGRRNLEPIDKVNLAYLVKDEVARKAKANQQVAGKEFGNRIALAQTNQTEITPINTNAELAEVAGVRVAMVKRVRSIKEKGVPELETAVKNKEVSVYKASRIASLPHDEQKQVLSEIVQTESVITAEEKGLGKDEMQNSKPDRKLTPKEIRLQKRIEAWEAKKNNPVSLEMKEERNKTRGKETCVIYVNDTFATAKNLYAHYGIEKLGKLRDHITQLIQTYKRPSRRNKFVV